MRILIRAVGGVSFGVGAVLFCLLGVLEVGCSKTLITSQSPDHAATIRVKEFCTFPDCLVAVTLQTGCSPSERSSNGAIASCTSLTLHGRRIRGLPRFLSTISPAERMTLGHMEATRSNGLITAVMEMCRLVSTPFETSTIRRDHGDADRAPARPVGRALL